MSVKNYSLTAKLPCFLSFPILDLLFGISGFQQAVFLSYFETRGVAKPLFTPGLGGGIPVPDHSNNCHNHS